MKVLIIKRLLAVFLSGAALLPAQAQLFGPEAINGAALGSQIGGFAGGIDNNGCGYSFSGDGAAIGAGIGLAAGVLIGAVNQQNAYSAQSSSYAPQSYAQPGYGYVYPPPVYAAPPPRPNYIVGGTLLGAASGALIGAGSNGQTGEGAAIGAASGLVLGSIAEYAAQKREKKSAAAPEVTAQPQFQTRPVPQPQPQANENSLKRGPSNTTYYWTTPPATYFQIADAPRVPDAPTF